MGTMRVTLVSTYDLGRQPFGLASPAAWLRDAGHEVHCIDTSRVPLQAGVMAGTWAVAFHLPMHTATRLSLPLIRRVREVNPAARLVAYGLYAPLNEAVLREAGVHVVLGVECEQALVHVLSDGTAAPPVDGVASALPRLHFRLPDRSQLPPLEQYAHLRLPNGARRVVGYTEASRGCKHWCRHCPVVPVYRGQFRAVPVDVVLADVAQQVDQGATHVTFGDPDFLNGPKHARAVVEGLAARFGGLTYDITVKVEHLVEHGPLLPVLRDTGCVLITSAFESFDDEVLQRLRKGHTGADAERALALCRAVGLTLAPTFVAFTPWTTLPGYAALLRRMAELHLVGQVAPIQLALRLLITQGSLLLQDGDVRSLLGEFDRERLVYPWSHAEPEVDALQRDVEALVAARPASLRSEVFAAVVDLVDTYAPCSLPPAPDTEARAAVPYLEEPWYC
jgi:radical SAM superfamily enzyme YgiQ (UPF0313 family)